MAFNGSPRTVYMHGSESKAPEIKVRKYLSHNEKSMGKSHKTWDWTFEIGGEKLDWAVKVNQAIVGANTMEFTIPSPGGKEEVFKGKLLEDYVHKLLVRGTLNLDKQYEVKSMNSSDICEWYPAVLLGMSCPGMKPDGKYEAEVLMPPDQYGNQKKVHYPIVEANRIRDPFSKEVVEIPQTTLQLTVKKDNLLLPELTINNNAFTSHFCVPSPAANKPRAEINICVSRDRKLVQADVGHETFKEELDATKPGATVYSSKVRSYSAKKTKLKSEWEIRIGAFGEHHIVAETKSKSSKEVKVTIDGNVVVGGSAADLGGNEWSADIAIQGKVMLKYTLYKTASNGNALHGTQVESKRFLRSNTIRISVPDISNLEHAILECDGVDFGNLEQYKPRAPEENMNVTLETLESTLRDLFPESHTASIAVPYAKKFYAMLPIADDFAEDMPGLPSSWSFISGVVGGFLNMFTCCQQATVDDYSQVVIEAGNALGSSSGSNWKEGSKSTPAA
eukprot:gnl/MRDRNA2_/MRDRNA2_83356_c0_seq2.p1 gnl/MRDRNA2_/MRDRNA2_83356_c0~~gnl/MRDRNA2_/MRDRNA2_83356_c0_seq2.p1  ORF type:complete len:505 (-),score=101.04 gnl/MRDRNA2_/MRDRNA2_83356_c0_seq2:260-1774(-)